MLQEFVTSLKKCITCSSLKKIISILFICCLFVPEAVRLVTFAACKFKSTGKDAALVCDCVLSSVPADMKQNSFPSRHKEIVQQTEWQYLVIEKIYCNPYLLTFRKNRYTPYFNGYSVFYNHSIFHPPCLG